MIRGVTIRNGATNFGGGGIANFSTLTLTNSIVSGNNANSGASFGGGGIFNPGTLTLTNSTVTGNSTDWSGGANNNGGNCWWQVGRSDQYDHRGNPKSTTSLTVFLSLLAGE